jgi:sugar/nucleoside kinase (ribokinase family)
LTLYIAFTLSDQFCIVRHWDDFRSLILNKVDILFGNQKEAYALFGTTDFDLVIQAAQEQCKIAVFTLGAKGSVIITKESVYQIASKTQANVVDTTGAGDLYAAGVLFGLSQGLDLQECGRLGWLASAENVTHFESRSKVALKQLL